MPIEYKEAIIDPLSQRYQEDLDIVTGWFVDLSILDKIFIKKLTIMANSYDVKTSEITEKNVHIVLSDLRREILKRFEDWNYQLAERERAKTAGKKPREAVAKGEEVKLF